MPSMVVWNYALISSNSIFYIGLHGRTWLWYNVSVNGCEVLENKYGKQNPIAGAVMRRVTHLITNMPKKCPVPKVRYICLFFEDKIIILPVFFANLGNGIFDYKFLFKWRYFVIFCSDCEFWGQLLYDNQKWLYF